MIGLLVAVNLKFDIGWKFFHEGFLQIGDEVIVIGLRIVCAFVILRPYLGYVFYE
jgi:hypothetical protein